MDEMTLTLSSPITEEQFDAITDVDFDNTDRIWFHTKHGKDVEFVKLKKGKWITPRLVYSDFTIATCSVCGERIPVGRFCINCGADLRGDENDQSK